MVGLIAFGICLAHFPGDVSYAIITSLSTPMCCDQRTALPLTAPAVALSTLIIIRHATTLRSSSNEAIEKLLNPRRITDTSNTTA